MKYKMKQLTGMLLSLSLIMGLMPGMSPAAYADDKAYSEYLVKILPEHWQTRL